jgi:hypothetical protein
MDTQIEFLEKLEVDLELAAESETRRAGARSGSAGPRVRKRGSRWRALVGVAAAVITLAWGVGWLATNGAGPRGQYSAAPAASPADAGRQQHGAESVPGLSQDGNGTVSWDAGGAPQPSASPGVVPGDFPTLTEGGLRGGFTITPSQPDLSKIIRDGEVSLVIDDETFADTFRQASLIAGDLGGFVLTSSTQNGDSGTLTIRIPAKRFDQAVDEISKLGKVESSKIEGQDVTAEYVDIAARLKILRARRASLLGFLDQATTLNASLQLSDRLDQVQVEIERIQGRQRFLDNQVAESTLTVAMREKNVPVEQAPPSPQPQETIDNPSLGRAWDRAVQGFFGVIATVIAGLGYLVPIGVLVALGVGVWWVARRRRTGVPE